MKRHRTAHGTNTGSGKTSLPTRSHGLAGHFFSDKAPRVLTAGCADPVTGLRNNEADVVDAFRDTIRGSVYELYQMRGWVPERD